MQVANLKSAIGIRCEMQVANLKKCYTGCNSEKCYSTFSELQPASHIVYQSERGREGVCPEGGDRSDRLPNSTLLQELNLLCLCHGLQEMDQ
jgi:hypothetical protein